MCLGGIIGGVASIFGGASSSKAAGKAADAQTEAARQQTELEKYIYEDTRDRFAPFYDSGLDFQNILRYELLGGDAPLIGGSAAPITTKTRMDTTRTPGNVYNNVGEHNQWLVDILNQGTTPGDVSGREITEYYVGDNVFSTMEEAQAYANANPVGGHQYGGFEASPGYKFALDQGQAAIDGSAAARGNVFSGATLKAQQEFGTGLAQQEYSNFLNRLTGQASQGQAAAGNIATAGSNYASGAGNALANMGNAQAAGYIGQANALNGAINNGLTAWGYMNSPSANMMTASNGISIPRNTMNSVQALF